MRYKVNDPENNDRGSTIMEQDKSSWFDRECGEEKTYKERRLVIVVVLLTVAVIALVATLCLQMTFFNSRGEEREMCQTDECIKTAARMIEGMNRTVAPCEDFYKFACSGWIARHPIPQSQSSWDQLSLLKEELLQNLRTLLEEPDRDDDLRPVKLARALYRTCMDTESVEKMGLKPIFEILSLVGLPRDPQSLNALENDTEIDLDVARIAGVAQRHLGLNLFVNFYISEDLRDTTKNRMMMDQVSPGFSERYLTNPDRFKSELMEYKRYIKEMVELAGMTPENSTLFADEILDFSTKIAKIMATTEERRSSNHFLHDVTVSDLQALTDALTLRWNWTEYLEAVFDNTDVVLDTGVDGIIVMDLDYFQKLPRLLSNTSSATVARFVWWSVYSTVAPLTLQKFRDLGFQFSQKVFGLKAKTPRWKGCTGNANSNFGMALTNLYVQRYFNEESREKALEMFLDIRAAFDEMVSELKWMDAGTRAKAHRKLYAMRPFVGFPQWINDPEKLNKFYEGAEVIPGQLFETFLRLTDVGAKKTLNSLREKPDKDRWITTGTTVNAFYSAILNSVTFPAGILHPPFYGNGLESINYGAMGAIMGHELTHGFDDQGRRYDENGNLRQWWSNETLRHYYEKVECIINQYSSYHLPELSNNFTINGINTQSENIADNGGIREAYRAYQRLKSRGLKKQALPGLSDYSQDQLFFLGFAQVWCGNYTNGALKSKIIEGVHSPNHFRVIGTLSNNEQFAKAWNCPVGSPMNPPHKCILW
ncbi:neprilysin-4-like isoform X1 [Diachasmimorpha longicaudata]|uniref:neprilysin-4-like isoform X1 n=2 Tax=Diachasmimorpha longicaudata TaxID=58733 RepID=UPI0030B8CC00